MRKILIIGAVAALVSSCQDKPISEMSYSEVKALSLDLHKRCWAQGIKDNSPEMKLCLQQEFNRESAMRADNLQRRQAMGAALIANGQSYNNAMMQPQFRPMNCTSVPSSTWVGGTVNQVRTNCY